MAQYLRLPLRSMSVSSLILSLPACMSGVTSCLMATCAQLATTRSEVKESKEIAEQAADICPKNTVYVCNIPVWANTDEVKESFGDLATGIVHIGIVKQQLGLPTVEAYVTFADASFYRRAIASSQKLKIRNTNRMFDISLVPPNAPIPAISTLPMAVADCVLFLKRLPLTADTPDRIKALLPDSGTDIESVHILRSRFSQRFSGMAYVTFKTQAAYEKALNAEGSVKGVRVPSSKVAMKAAIERQDRQLPKTLIKLRVPSYGGLTEDVFHKIFAPLRIRHISFLPFEACEPLRSIYVTFFNQVDAERTADIVQRLRWKWMPLEPSIPPVPVKDVTDDASNNFVLRLQAPQRILDEIYVRSLLKDCAGVKKIHVADPRLNGLLGYVAYVELSDEASLQAAVATLRNLKTANKEYPYAHPTPRAAMIAAMWHGRGYAYPVIVQKTGANSEDMDCV